VRQVDVVVLASSGVRATNATPVSAQRRHEAVNVRVVDVKAYLPPLKLASNGNVRVGDTVTSELVRAPSRWVRRIEPRKSANPTLVQLELRTVAVAVEHRLRVPASVTAFERGAAVLQADPKQASQATWNRNAVNEDVLRPDHR